jgi:transmembrane sensor
MRPQDPRDDRDPTALSQQAAHWWVVLNEPGCTAADREAFAAWVRRSPERVEAFLHVSMLHSALRSGTIRWPDTPAEELIRQARAAPDRVASIGDSRRVDVVASAARRDPSSRRSALMLLAASLATLFAVALFLWVRELPNEYRTGLGEQRSVVLDDGSIVNLNTSSQIEVDYGEQRRLIRLVNGEALFNVVHDAERPFDVAVGDIIVRAVGTQFNVDLRTDRTTVTVVEGKVRVSSARDGAQGDSPGSGVGSRQPLDELVVAAQRIVVTHAGLGTPEPVRNVAPVTAWTQRQLIFESRPLSEVAAEFNRYNRRPILIESAALRSQQVTGVFQANDSASFLAFISGIPGVVVQTDDAGHHVTSSNDRTEGAGAGGGPE